MDDVPFLNDLSLADLDGLANVVSRLIAAGDAVARGNLTARFSLVPGQQATMVLNVTMPEIYRLATEAALVSDDLSEFPAPAPQEPAPGIGGEGAQVTLPAEQLEGGFFPALTRHLEKNYPSVKPATVEALPAGAFVDNTPDQPAPACPPGSASALAANRPAPWTDEEHDRAVAIYVAAIRAGDKIGVAQSRVATALDRPLEGTKFRLKNKLGERIEAEILRLRNGDAVAAALSDAVQADAPAAAAKVDAPAETPPVDPRLRRHIAALSKITHGKRWTEQEDLALLEGSVSGLKLGEIAADMGLDTGRVKHRLEMLCGSFTAVAVLHGLRQSVEA